MDQYLYHINNRNGFGKYGNEIRIGIPIVVSKNKWIKLCLYLRRIYCLSHYMAHCSPKQSILGEEREKTIQDQTML